LPTFGKIVVGLTVQIEKKELFMGNEIINIQVESERVFSG
jgi:hypothetical protein